MSCDAFCLAAPEAEGEHPEAESRSRVRVGSGFRNKGGRVWMV